MKLGTHEALCDKGIEDKRLMVTNDQKIISIAPHDSNSKTPQRMSKFKELSTMVWHLTV